MKRMLKSSRPCSAFLGDFFAECVRVIVITITSIFNSNSYIYLDMFDNRFMKAHQYESIEVHELDKDSSSLTN